MNKKENILKVALKLFAENGFDATSTKKIALAAGVSEGLIFRHFINKENLLNAILEIGIEKTNQYYQENLQNKNPKKIIEAALELPFKIPESDHAFWHLLYALKWQRKTYYPELAKPLLNALKQAFEALNYENPEIEAEFILVYIDGMATSILLKEDKNNQEILNLLKNKYQLK